MDIYRVVESRFDFVIDAPVCTHDYWRSAVRYSILVDKKPELWWEASERAKLCGCHFGRDGYVGVAVFSRI